MEEEDVICSSLLLLNVCQVLTASQMFPHICSPARTNVVSAGVCVCVWVCRKALAANRKRRGRHVKVAPAVANFLLCQDLQPRLPVWLSTASRRTHSHFLQPRCHGICDKETPLTTALTEKNRGWCHVGT